MLQSCGIAAYKLPEVTSEVMIAGSSLRHIVDKKTKSQTSGRFRTRHHDHPIWICPMHVAVNVHFDVVLLFVLFLVEVTHEENNLFLRESI
jgi:hypothetical protein